MQIQQEKKIAARCIMCRAEFTEQEIETADCCPNCKTKSLPEDPKFDIQITINWHSLRILCMWAKNWEDKTKEEAEEKRSIVDVITKELSKFRPEGAASLSFVEELQEALQVLNKEGIIKGGAELIGPDGEVTVITPKTLH